MPYLNQSHSFSPYLELDIKHITNMCRITATLRVGERENEWGREGKDWDWLSAQPFKFSSQGSKAFYFACDPSTCHSNFPSCSSSFNCFHISIIISFLLHLKLSLTTISLSANGIHLPLSSHWVLQNEKWSDSHPRARTEIWALKFTKHHTRPGGLQSE